MNEWPCMEAEIGLQVATKKLVEASDALKFLRMLPSSATTEERLTWQDDFANVKILLDDAQKAFKENCDTLLQCKEQFSGRI